jgi:succinoglycan biosynthesis protein ExoM
MTEVVAICVCTCQRPKMLRACLDSLVAQCVSEGHRAYIIVVDNDPKGSAAAVVAEHAQSSPIVTHYVAEPVRGIAQARNAALNAVRSIGADWIAFIDDDEVAAPDWIAALMASEYKDTPILVGRHILVPPEPYPFWYVPREPRAKPEGEWLRTALTNNVRFSFDVVRAGIRFNERLGFMGGEDGEFFATAYRRGYHIRRTLRAVTYETQHASRLTYFGLAYRSYWNAASDVRRLAVQRGWGPAIGMKLTSVPFNVLAGAAEIVVSPVFVIAGIDAFKRRAVAGGKKIGKGLGRGAAIVGLMPRPYAIIDGN